MPQARTSAVRLTVTLGFTQTLGWGSTYYLPAILATPMARDLGISTGNVFAAFSSALLVTAFLGPAVGRRIDNRGGRSVLTISSILFATGLILMAFAAGAAMLWGAWFLMGFGMAMGLYDAAFATLTSIYGNKARSSITGITLIAGFASTICWPITAWLESEFGWRGACLAWAGVHILLGLPMNRWGIPLSGATRKSHAISAAAGDNTAIQHNTSGISSTPEQNAPGLAMPLLAFVFAITWFISTGVAAHLPQLLMDAGLSATAAITAAALIGPAQVAARLAEFSFLRDANPLHSARAASLTHPIGALALVLFGTPLAFVFSLLHGAGNGILTIAKGTLPLAIFGPLGYGHRVGKIMVPARFAQALAPFIFALMLTAWGTNVLLITGALGIASFIALTILNQQTKRKAVCTNIPV